MCFLLVCSYSTECSCFCCLLIYLQLKARDHGAFSLVNSGALQRILFSPFFLIFKTCTIETLNESSLHFLFLTKNCTQVTQLLQVKQWWFISRSFQFLPSRRLCLIWSHIWHFWSLRRLGVCHKMHNKWHLSVIQYSDPREQYQTAMRTK